MRSNISIIQDYIYQTLTQKSSLDIESANSVSKGWWFFTPIADGLGMNHARHYQHTIDE